MLYYLRKFGLRAILKYGDLKEVKGVNNSRRLENIPLNDQLGY